MSPGELAQGVVTGCTMMLFGVVSGVLSSGWVARSLSGVIFLLGLVLALLCYRRLRGQ